MTQIPKLQVYDGNIFQESLVWERISRYRGLFYLLLLGVMKLENSPVIL
jgi:hypothetical protein